MTEDKLKEFVRDISSGNYKKILKYFPITDYSKENQIYLATKSLYTYSCTGDGVLIFNHIMKKNQSSPADFLSIVKISDQEGFKKRYPGNFLIAAYNRKFVLFKRIG